MSQSLPYVSNIPTWQLAMLTALSQITSASQVPENASTLDLRTHLDNKSTEATRNRELRERHRKERDTEREAHKATKLDATKQAKQKDQEISSTKAALKTQSEKIKKLEEEVSLRHQGVQDPIAFEKACSTKIERAEAERNSYKKELAALHDAIDKIEMNQQPAKLRQIALTNKAERLEADLALKEVERNELVKTNARLVDQLKCARMNIKAGMDDMAQMKISSDADCTQLTDLKLKLKESEAQRDMLAKQIGKLVEAREKLKNERNDAIADAKKAKEDATTHQSSVEEMLKGLDHQSKTDLAQFSRLQQQVKTVVGAKTADLKEQNKEIDLLNAQMEELLLENTELREEVRLYKNDSGVIVLDSD
jgi:hypothetical protein